MKPVFSTRLRWVLSAATGALIVCGILYGAREDFCVIVYNNTGEPLQAVAVSVGNKVRDKAVLEPRESVEFQYGAVEPSSDIRLSAEKDPPLRWSAPKLAAPGISRVILRYEDQGGITMSVDKRWTEKLADWLK